MKKNLLWATLGLSLLVLTGCQEVKDFFTTPNVTIPPSVTSVAVVVDGKRIPGQIREMDKVATIYVPEGTDRSMLVTEFDFVGQDATPAPGFVHDYTSGPALISVTKDGVTVVYEVTVVATSVVVPTVADLVGTWSTDFIFHYTSDGGEGPYGVTESGVFTVTFNSDGTYFQKRNSVEVADNGQPDEYSYSEERGTYEIDQAGNLVVHEAEYRADTQPIADALSWNPSNYTTGKTIILVNGRIYGGFSSSSSSILKAQGPTEGVVGTWVYSSFSQSDADPTEFYRAELTFNADGTCTQLQFEGTSPESLTLVGSMTATYTTDQELGTITIKPEGSQGQPMQFAIWGQYFVAASPDMPNMGGLVRVLE